MTGPGRAAGTASPAAAEVLVGGGYMGALMRSLDWSLTPIGDVPSWPQSLRTAVSICLSSRFPILIWWGPELVKLYNEAYRPILGDKHPASLGQAGRDCWPEIWHIIGPMLEGVLERGEATWSEDQLLVLERRGYPEECYFTFSYSPIRDESGGVGGVFTAVTETTHKVLSERRMHTLRNLAADAVEAGTSEGVCATAARRLGESAADVPFALLYLSSQDGGRARLEETVGLEAGTPASPTDIDLRGDPSESPWPLALVSQTGEPVWLDALDARWGTLPGGSWPIPARRAAVLPIAQPGHHPYGFLVAGVSPCRELDDEYRTFYRMVAGHIATAITSARVREEERRRADALAELDRAKTAFFSNVSHELRTPLTLILGPIQDGLRAQGQSALQREGLEILNRNALRLLKLVDALLDFSRIEAGWAKAVFEPTDVASLTSELAAAFRSTMERAGLRLVVDTPPLSEPLYVDRQMWEKIVLNFISNAFKFTFQGEVEVSLHELQGLVELRVRDTGTGIPPQELERVFDRFHRVEGTRARTHEGAGIGLALVRELARLHGGEVFAESELGSGSTFRVRIPTGSAHLPARQIRSEPDSSPTTTGPTPYVEEALNWLRRVSHDASLEPVAGGESRLDASPFLHEGARVLVADDNADMRGYLKRLLEHAGYRVEAVPDGARALEAAHRELPDLILSDVMMPQMDGFQLLAALRQGPATRVVPFVLLSARAGEESRVEGLAAGADDYLVKPFSARELLARISTHLEMARLRRETQSKLTQILMQAPVAMCVLSGPDLVYEMANPLYLRMMGRKDVIGRPIREVFPELSEGAPVLRSFEQALTTGRPFTADEYPVRFDRRGTGQMEDAFFQLTVQPVTDNTGAVGAIVVVAVDITEQVRAREQIALQAARLRELQAHTKGINDRLERTNEELIARRREAENANKVKSQFLARMSHELRTPLTAIIGYAELLASGMGSLTEVQRRQLERIDLAARHLLRIIEEILSFSRIEAGRETVHLEKTNLVDLVREAVALIEPLAKEKGLEVHMDGPNGISLDTDPGKVRQIVLNLLSNAVRFTDSGGVEVEAAEEASWAVLRVRDTGVGVPAEQLERIFEPFRQAEHRGARRAGGTGLGLSVTRHLARLLGGDVLIESAPGQGSTFTVRLPLRAGSSTHPAGPPTTTAEPLSSLPPIADAGGPH
jgi:PAS domain S-box-containing protein